MDFSKNNNAKMKLLAFAACGLLGFQQVQCRQQAVNDFTETEVSATQRFIYDVTDFFLYEALGVTDASPETVKFVLEMQKQMGMEQTTIRVRSFSRGAMRYFGRENVAVLSFPHANTILIGEEWFNTLPEIEKKALIGHGLAHIKNKHIYKKMGVVVLTNILVASLAHVVSDNVFVTQIVPVITAMIAGLAYGRLCVYEADKVSALEFDNTEGIKALMMTFKDLRDPHSRFAFKCVMRRVGKFVTYPVRKLMATHPSCANRIKAMERLELAGQ